MSKAFTESQAFTARWKRRGDDELLRALQNDLLESPDRGDAMPGCGILRKYRFSDRKRGKGKRGGARIIYLYVVIAARIFLIRCYAKNMKSDLTVDEKKQLRQIAANLKGAQ